MKEKSHKQKSFNYETPVIIERLGEEDGSEIKPVIIRSIPPTDSKIEKSNLKVILEEESKPAGFKPKTPLIEKLEVKIESTER